MAAWSLDARIPLHLLRPGETPAPGMALLAEAPAEVSATAMALFSLTGAHVPACACCGVRGPVAEALDRLFLGRVRGTLPWFSAIAALPQSAEAAEAICNTLRDDAASSARFRLVPQA
ncbi:MAG: hypothetical protein O9313_09610 [Acetobacteraceae bacterium]|jgi:hypothetical protein|nr:hypothetical protein [Acetobacteraceae bacterium]